MTVHNPVEVVQGIILIHTSHHHYHHRRRRIYVFATFKTVNSEVRCILNVGGVFLIFHFLIIISLDLFFSPPHRLNDCDLMPTQL